MIGLCGDVVCVGVVDICIVGGCIVEMGFDFMFCFGECVIDVSDCIVYLGWINMYYYLFQNLFKVVLEGMN